MLLLFLTVIYSCIVYVGQKPTRACVVLLFKYADYKYNLSYLILSYLILISGLYGLNTIDRNKKIEI